MEQKAWHEYLAEWQSIPITIVAMLLGMWAWRDLGGVTDWDTLTTRGGVIGVFTYMVVTPFLYMAPRGLERIPTRIGLMIFFAPFVFIGILHPSWPPQIWPPQIDSFASFGIFFGLMVILFSLAYLEQEWNYRISADRRAIGTVIDNQGEIMEGVSTSDSPAVGGAPTYHPVFEFVADGVTYQVVGNAGEIRPRKVGETVTICYRSETPTENWALEGDSARATPVYVVIGIASVLTAIAIFLELDLL